MRANELPDGYYFVQEARIRGLCSGTIKSKVIKKVGNQINYFGTEYWDRADQLEGEFSKININNYRK